MINETNPENYCLGSKPTVKVLRPARQLGDNSRYQAINKLLHRGGLEGSGLKKIIGESWNAISQSTPSRNGYRKRMLQIWVEKGMFQVTEQRPLRSGKPNSQETMAK